MGCGIWRNCCATAKTEQRLSLWILERAGWLLIVDLVDCIPGASKLAQPADYKRAYPPSVPLWVHSPVRCCLFLVAEPHTSWLHICTQSQRSCRSSRFYAMITSLPGLVSCPGARWKGTTAPGVRLVRCSAAGLNNDGDTTDKPVTAPGNKQQGSSPPSRQLPGGAQWALMGRMVPSSQIALSREQKQVRCNTI